MNASCGRSTRSSDRPTDPDGEAKLIDVIGFCVNPSERAVAFSLDTSTQGQTLDRAQSSMPRKAGRGRFSWG
jgi:hypothetical protein